MGDTYTRQSSYTDGDVITAAHTNDEFNQLLAAFAASTGHTHDGTAAEGGPITKLLGNALTFGAGTAGTDITITFDGETSDGELKWMEDEDYFEFSDDILVASTEKLQFRDTAIYINSSADGQLDLVADTEIQIAATTIDINGNVDISGTLTIGSAGISETELEILDGATVTTTELNILDGDTSATSTTVADADRVVFNDAGTMKQVAVTDLAAYFDDEITAMPNLVTTGALDSGSITSGFGTIDTGSSTITTTGLITGGSLDIDDVLINGSTIGHTDDTDLMTLSNGVLTIAGEVDAVSLDVSGDADIDGTLEADAITIAGVTLAETISDTVGAMVSSNTETGISVTYDDSDNTLDFVLGTAQTTIESVKNTSLVIGRDDDNLIKFGTDNQIIFEVSGGDNVIFKASGEIEASSLDISGDADIDGTLEADAITVNGTALNTVIAGVTVTDATNSAHVLVTDNESTNEENLITFVEDATSSTGNVGLEMDGNLTYNPSTGTITSTIFKGNIDAVDGDFDGTLEADAITLNGTAITATATLDTGISNNNVPKFTSGVADNDFLRVDGTAIEGRSASEVLSDISAAPAAGDSNIVTTGALNSGSITSGFGAINNGSSAITTTGTMTFGSLSDGSITVTAFVDEDDMSSNSATLIPTQQSVKAFVEANAGSFNSFFIEDDDGTEVTIDNAKELKFIGSGITTNFTDTSTGSDGDPFDLTFTVDAAQTGITSILATDLKIGEDDQTKIDFETADEIHFYAANAEQVFVSDGVFGPQTDSDVDLGTTGARFKDAYVDSVTITGAFTAGDQCVITSANNVSQLVLKSTDADGSLGPKLDLVRDSSSPADGDNCGQINFFIDNDAGQSIQYGDIFVGATDVSDSQESAHMTFSTMKAGSRNSRMKLHSDETVFNEDSVDVDFRVESNGDANLLKVDAGNDVFGVGAASPDTTFRTSIHGDGSSIVGGTLYRNASAGGNTFTVGFVNATSTSGKLNVVGAGNLIFATNNTEAARITSGGRVGIGQNNPAGRLDVNNDGATTETLLILSDFGGTGAHTQISFNNTAGQVGTINTSGSGTTYSTTSDIRLKQDIEPLEATDKLMDMNPVSYAWKADPDGPRSMGFIAQEMKEIVPDAVFGDDSEEKMMSMDYGRITPVLVSALQDAHKKIEELESRIAAMESK